MSPYYSNYLLPMVLGCLAVQASGYAAGGDYEHFLGTYAYEATPYWATFEIARANDGFTARMPDGWKIADLRASDNALVGKDDDGRDVSVQYDRAKERYVLAGATQISAYRGTQDVRYRRVLVKAKPMPGKALEEQYGVTAAALVRSVRRSEQWMHEFDSLHFVAEVTWTRTPAGIEHRKKQVKIEHPDADLSREGFWGLRPVEKGSEEYGIDRRRFRRSENYPGKHERVLIWDGRLLTAYNKYYTHEQEDYFIDPELGNRGTTLLGGLAWPRSQAQKYWWWGDVEHEINRDDWDGRAEDFVLTGKDEYCGVSCYVLECLPKEFRRVRRWYVGIEDGRLRGNLVYEQGQLTWEYWTDQYQQVQSGWWFPTVQGYHHFARRATAADEAEDATREDGLDHFIASCRDIRVTSVEVNQPLTDEQFEMEFKEGVKVADLRFGGMVTYRYKKGMTDEDWEQIRREALQRAERDVARTRALDARIGQESPAFPISSKWLNSEPLTWQSLRGKAVVLQFWGIGCGPCHNYIRFLGAAGEDADVIMIGVHVPEDDMDAVKELMAKYEADGPICVDVPADSPGQGFGSFSGWFGVKGIPSWCVVGPDGKVGGHSMTPHEAFQIARKSLATPEN